MLVYMYMDGGHTMSHDNNYLFVLPGSLAFYLTKAVFSSERGTGIALKTFHKKGLERMLEG